MMRKAAFCCALLICCFRWCSAPLALALGLGFGVSGANPWPPGSSRASRVLLKLSIIGLGFGIDLGTVLNAGRVGFLYTGVGIVTAMALGIALGRVLEVSRNSA